MLEQSLSVDYLPLIKKKKKKMVLCANYVSGDEVGKKKTKKNNIRLCTNLLYL